MTAKPLAAADDLSPAALRWLADRLEDEARYLRPRMNDAASALRAIADRDESAQVAWQPQPIETAPLDAEFLAENKHGDWLVVRRFKGLLYWGAEGDVINARTGRWWTAKRWLPLPSTLADGADKEMASEPDSA